MEAPLAFKLSRESRIRIDRDGAVWHEGDRIENPKLARALLSWIALDEDSDRYILKNAMDWCFVTVDDAPLVVQTASLLSHGAELSLSDGTVETLDPDTLRIDGDDVPYCDVKGKKIPARFDRASAFALLQAAREERMQYVITLAGRDHVIRRVPRGAGAPKREPAHPDDP